MDPFIGSRRLRLFRSTHSRNGAVTIALRLHVWVEESIAGRLGSAR
jgi:hypothetical protein